MAEKGLECAACGEPLSPREGMDRCGCPLCGAIHAVDRSASPPAVRLGSATELVTVTKRAHGELKAVTSDLRFLEADAASQRNHVAFAIVVLVVLCLLGVGVIVYAAHMEEKAKEDPEASRGTVFMPTMSKTAQTILSLRIVGGVMLLAALLAVFLLPWRRWREAKRVLRIARGNREVLEDLVRRLEETARRAAP